MKTRSSRSKIGLEDHHKDRILNIVCLHGFYQILVVASED